MTQTYRITLLPGDGIGPEIIAVAVAAMHVVGAEAGIAFEFQEALLGGAAIEATGEPLPAETLAKCKDSDGVLLAAIGGYKWDTLPRHLRPETGLLGLRAGLGLFANLRPASILPQLIDASTLKKEVVEGVEYHGGAGVDRWRVFWATQGHFRDGDGRKARGEYDGLYRIGNRSHRAGRV